MSDFSTILDITGNSVLLGLLSFFVFHAFVLHKFFSVAEKQEGEPERRLVSFLDNTRYGPGSFFRTKWRSIDFIVFLEVCRP